MGDAWSYDLSDQLATVTPDAHNVDTTPSDGTKAIYNLDESGNRKKLRYQTSGGLLLPGELYQTNDLNQYTASGSFGTTALTYDANGNLASKSNPNGRQNDTWTYVYDAQNRLTHAHDDDLNEHLDFYYDALGRQILRYVNGEWIYSVWDGWDLIEEYSQSSTMQGTYLYGAGGELVRRWYGPYADAWYHQDGRGNTSHVSADGGALLESYTYDLYGKPTVYDPSGAVRAGGTAYNVSHLFTGQRWIPQVGPSGMYDCRNRFMFPEIGRFVQADPIGFGGGNNLYSYSSNNSVNVTDPMGTKPQYIHSNLQHFSGSHGDDWSNAPGYASGSPIGDAFGVGYDGNDGAGIYVANKGRLGVNLGGGLVYGGPGNRNGLSYGGKPVVAIFYVNAPPSQSDGDASSSSKEPKTIVVRDVDLIAELQRTFDRVSAADVPHMTNEEFRKFMLGFDTSFRAERNLLHAYSGSLGPPAGTYYGSAINYIGVGEGFSARGFSVLRMNTYITGWRIQYITSGEFFRGGEFDWARVGYDYYSNHGPGG